MMLIDASRAGSRRRVFPVPRSGQPPLAGSVMESSANLALAADAIAKWARHHAAGSPLLVDKSFRVAKDQKQLVTETR